LSECLGKECINKHSNEQLHPNIHIWTLIVSTCMYTLRLACTHPHMHTPSHPHILTHTHTSSHIHPQTHVLTCMHTHIHPQTRTCTHPHTLTPTPSPDNRRAEADHQSGDRADWVEERGDQVSEERTLPGCPRVCQSAHVTPRSDP